MFLFFTPDARVPPEEQLYDCVTGIWWCERDGLSWGEPVRAFLVGRRVARRPDVRTGRHAVVRVLQDGRLQGGRHLHGDVERLVVELAERGSRTQQRLSDRGGLPHSLRRHDGLQPRRPAFGVFGAYDLWESYREFGGGWTEPLNLGPVVNTTTFDGWPYLSPNGNELWFTSFVSDLGYPGPCIYRTLRTDRGWTEPEEMVSHYVGDPAMDPDGNLYFTHHYINDGGTTIETDIYVCYRR